MFRNYIKESLDINQYNKINKEASEGEKYCNFLCQKYIKIEDFYDGKATCKECYNHIVKIRKMIDLNQLTAEQFKEDPTIVAREKTIIPVFRECITCKEELSLEKFENTRKECIQCRRKKKKINYEEQFEKYRIGIEAVKTDINALNNLLKAMSADLIKLVVKEYKISMSHSDRKKDIMIVKIVDHFQSLLNPYICLGKCGCKLPTQFSVCDECKLKPKNSAEEIMMEFENKLDDLVDGLESMKPEEGYQYNKKQIILIAKKLGIKFYQTQDKPIIMQLIDKHLQDKKEAEINDIKKQMGGEISLNGITVLSRPDDGFINATAMCKAGGKLFKHWNSLESTKELIKELQKAEKLKLKNTIDLSMTAENIEDLSRSVGIATDLSKPMIDIIKTGPNNQRGSWIHPDLAVHLAMWLSPKFGIQVSGWIRELALCGSVSIGKEKTQQQLLELQSKYKKLEDNHHKILQKKHYYKFKEGPTFYIISDIDGKSLKFKAGFEGVDIDIRMGQHRSSLPGCKLEYLIYTKDAKLEEDAVLKRFESMRKLLNHEWIFDVDIKYIIKSTRTILDVLNIEYTEEENINNYNHQIDLEFEF